MEDVLLFTAIVLFHEYYRSLKYKTAFWSERNGRKRVEKEMINMSKYQLQTDKGFFIQPIGNLKSCYRQCIGTPRQGKSNEQIIIKRYGRKNRQKNVLEIIFISFHQNLSSKMSLHIYRLSYA